MKLREKQYDLLTTEANERLDSGDSRADVLEWLNKQVNSITNTCISKQSYLAPDKEEWKDRLEGAEEARDQFIADTFNAPAKFRVKRKLHS